MLYSSFSFAGLTCESLFSKTFSGYQQIINLVKKYSKNQGDKLPDPVELSKMIEKVHRQVSDERDVYLTKAHLKISKTQQKIFIQKESPDLTPEGFETITNLTREAYEALSNVIYKTLRPSEITLKAQVTEGTFTPVEDKNSRPYIFQAPMISIHPNKPLGLVIHEGAYKTTEELIMSAHPHFQVFRDYFKLLEEPGHQKDQAEQVLEFYKMKEKEFENNTSPISNAEYVFYSYLELTTENIRSSYQKSSKILERKIKKYERKHDSKLNEIGENHFSIDEFIATSHKFLSDTLATLGRRDAEGNYLKLAPEKMRTEVKTYNKRSGLSPAQLKNQWDYEGVHQAQAPLRNSVWNDYISQPKYRNQPQYLFERIFRGTVNELLTRYKSEKGNEYYSPSQTSVLNRRVLDAIDKEFETNPL